MSILPLTFSGSAINADFLRKRKFAGEAEYFELLLIKMDEHVCPFGLDIDFPRNFIQWQISFVFGVNAAVIYCTVHVFHTT